MPPGYKDKKKDEIYHHRGVIYQSKFGDLILYKQILEYCKTHHIKNVIFISQDNAKGDWVDKETKMICKEIRGESFEVASIQNFIMMNQDSLLMYSKVEKSSQMQEDFERADNIYGESIKLKTDLLVIGKRIIDIIYDKSLSLNSKLTILEELRGKKWSDESIEWIKGHFHNRAYVLIYESVVSALYTDDDSIDTSALESEMERIIKDKRIDQNEKRYLIYFLSYYIPWLDEGERYRLMRENELSYIKERLFL